ncbi:MAG: glutamate racemase [Lachnospiraceae bacterium]|nr:glutamate racemase [Lachnospiraceae bacterium]
MTGQEKDKAIGVFDSGVGGLTVFRELMELMPEERIVYFGDTARVPYGSKSRETVTDYSRQIIRFLRTQDVKAIVVACNTASAVALDEIEGETDIPIIGVVKPGALAASRVTKNGRIGIIATEATISSGIYEKYLKEIRPQMKIFGKACPLFVPLVEEGWLKDRITEEIAERYLTGLKGCGIDTLVLGCTHYPMLEGAIRQIMGEEVVLVNPAYETARECRAMLMEQGLLSEKGIGPEEKAYHFFVSDAAEKFKSVANMFLPMGIEGAQKIPIEQFAYKSRKGAQHIYDERVQYIHTGS